MAIRFIMGPSGSGKTEELYKMILEEAKNEPLRNIIVLVPEQVNFQTQKALVKRSPVKGIYNIDVLSFERLSHRIFDEAGGGRLPVLDDMGKSLILRRVAADISSQLKYLSAGMGKLGYINEVKSVISELMQYDIYPDKLKEAAQMGYSGLTGEKMADIEKLYEAFLKYNEEKYITQEEVLDRAVQAAVRADFLSDCSVYLDGYTGFTPVQLKLLAYLATRCHNIVITLLFGNECLGDSGIDLKAESRNPLFSMSYQMYKSVLKIAGEKNISVEKPVILSENFRNHSKAQLLYLEKNLFRRYKRRNEYVDNCGEIKVFEASDMRKEAAGTGRYIYELVRKKGYKYGDIAILTGDIEGYERVIDLEFAKYDIPVFFDRRRKVLLNPFTELLRSLLDIVEKGFDFESVFRFLKSGITPFSTREVDEFENYCIEAGIKYKKHYYREWTYLPKGTDETELIILNKMREKLIGYLSPLTDAMPGSGKYECTKMIKALYDTITGMQLYDRLIRLSEHFEEAGDTIRSQEYSAVYGKIMELFDRIVELLGDEKLSVSDLSDIVDAGLSELSVGMLPPGVDEVMVGDLERSRIDSPKVLILMGVNDGLIPKDSSKSGILNDRDRTLLKKNKLMLAPTAKEETNIQKYYLYMYLTRASEKLVLSYSLTGTDGSSRRPSYLIRNIISLFKGLEAEFIKKPQELLTGGEALEELTGILKKDEKKAMELMSALIRDCDLKDVIYTLLDTAFKRKSEDKIRQAVARAIYGDEITGSVTRLEKFAQCAYSHFVSYGLKLIQRREYGMGVQDLGTFFHNALKLYAAKLEKAGYGWINTDEAIAKRLMEEAVSEVLGKNSAMAVYESSRSAYMERRIRRILLRTISVIKYQLEKGDFEPEEFEQPFYENEVLNDSVRLSLRGQIDRIDIYREGDTISVKIVDYKSGNKTLELSKVYHGLSLQLFLYLESEIARLRKQAPEAVIERAGVLYYHIDDPVLDRADGENEADIFKRVCEALIPKGYVNSSHELLRHLDRTLDKKSDVIPVGLTAKGEFSKASKVLGTDEFIELERYVKKKSVELTEKIAEGDISVKPYAMGDENACTYCRYKDICGFEEDYGRGYRKLAKMEEAEVLTCILQRNREA